jgi:hypothetical protein
MLVSAFALATAAIHPEHAYTNGWVKDEAHASAFHPLTITFAVKEQNIEEVKRIALEVSNPQSPKYGQYISQAKLDALIAPKSSDMTAVVSWLNAHSMEFKQRGVSNLVVNTNVHAASALLNTRFHAIRNAATSQLIVRASDYELPDAVHDAVAAVFGLHGLPLPPMKPIVGTSAPGTPALVTPDVIESTYKIAGVKATRSPKNRQAVAEFQGQLMNTTDLATMFKKYVTGYEVGTDDVVTKFVGTKAHTEGAGVEAELDIQYIMGVNPGIQTEFWEFPAMDFCNDLNQWTSNLTSNEDIPIVHSVSYGWQGNLTQVHCMDKDLTVVDGNFAKLAAKGVSIMISSGDSGSGYSAQNTQCMGAAGQGQKGVGIDGTVLRRFEARESMQCCEEANGHPGWTFVPAAKPSTDILFADNFSYTFNNAEYHTVVPGAPSTTPFKTRDIDHIDGKVDSDGGTATIKNANGTFPDATLKFSKPTKPSSSSPEYYAEFTTTIGGADFKGRAIFFVFPGQPPRCVNLEIMKASGALAAILESGGNPPPPPPPTGRDTRFVRQRSR